MTDFPFPMFEQLACPKYFRNSHTSLFCFQSLCLNLQHLLQLAMGLFSPFSTLQSSVETNVHVFGRCGRNPHTEFERKKTANQELTTTDGCAALCRILYVTNIQWHAGFSTLNPESPLDEYSRLKITHKQDVACHIKAARGIQTSERGREFAAGRFPLNLASNSPWAQAFLPHYPVTD